MLESWNFRLAMKSFLFLVLICTYFATFTNSIYHLLAIDFPNV